MRRFGGLNKRLRSKRRADKLWVECGVGMERSETIAVAEAEGSLVPGAYTALLCAVNFALTF
jgi:hypothetical protein